MTDFRIFDPTKVRGLFEEKDAEIRRLRDALADFRKEMELKTIPAIVQAVQLRESFAEEARRRFLMPSQPLAAQFTVEQIIQQLQRAEPNAVPRALCWMREQGSSVLLNWGEDDNLWEMSWITSGRRFTDHHENMTAAIVGCLLKVKAVENKAVSATTEQINGAVN